MLSTGDHSVVNYHAHTYPHPHDIDFLCIVLNINMICITLHMSSCLSVAITQAFPYRSESTHIFSVFNQAFENQRARNEKNNREARL